MISVGTEKDKMMSARDRFRPKNRQKNKWYIFTAKDVDEIRIILEIIFSRRKDPGKSNIYAVSLVGRDPNVLQWVW